MITEELILKALELAQQVSPTEKSSNGFSLMLREMRKDNCSLDYQLRTIVSGIMDDLLYGNWPY